MVCEVCRHDAPYTEAQLARRQSELDRNPTLDVYPCPDCGGRDYMLSTINLNHKPPDMYDGILTAKIKAQRRPTRWQRFRSWWSRIYARP